MSEVTENVQATQPSTPIVNTAPTISAEALLSAAKDVFGEAPAAEAPAETPKPEDAAKTDAVQEEKKEEPKDERVAAKISAARRSEERARKERLKLQQAKEEFERVRRETEEYKRKYEALKDGDPIQKLKAIGVDPLDFMKRAASDPEVADPIASKIKELETRLEQEQRARLEMVQQQQLAYVDTSVTEAQRIFVESIAESADKYPHLVKEFTAEELAQRGIAIAREYAESYKAQTGYDLTDDVIAEQLEAEAQERAERREKFWASRVKAVPASQAAAPVNAVAPRVPGEQPRTLTADATVTTEPSPKWSQEWADQESLRILNARLANK